MADPIVAALAVTTIMIVDDNRENRKYLVTVLRHQGYRVLEACDGGEGLAAIRAEHPDLVITDVLMPVMDGFELVRQLGLDHATSMIPVVFYTAHYGEREARELALASGVAFILTKPAGSAMLLEVVVRALSGQSGPRMPPIEGERLTAFDREHLRLVTDKLAEKSGSLKAANVRLRGLIGIGLDLASEPDAGRLLQSVCVAARDLFGATYVTLGLLDRSNGTVQRVLTCEADGVGASPGTPWFDIGGPVPGILEEVVNERRMMRIGNPGGNPAGLRLPSSHPEVQALLVAPIASPERVYGWICFVCNEEGGNFSEEDERLVVVLAGQIGRIYENSLFHTVAQKRAVELQNNGHAKVMLVAVDTEARIRLINDYACSVLGRSASELLGRDWIDTCVPARIREPARRRLNDVICGQLVVSKNPVVNSAGDERLLEWSSSLLHDADGRVIGAISSGTELAGLPD